MFHSSYRVASFGFLAAVCSFSVFLFLHAPHTTSHIRLALSLDALSSYYWELILLGCCYFSVPSAFFSNDLVCSFPFFRFYHGLLVFCCLLTNTLLLYFSVNIITRWEYGWWLQGVTCWLPNLTTTQINSCYVIVTYISQLAITCSKLTIETLEQGVKYVQR